MLKRYWKKSLKTKMMDLAVIERAQRETLEQRLFVEKYQGSVDDVIKIFQFLWKCLFVSTG